MSGHTAMSVSSSPSADFSSLLNQSMSLASQLPPPTIRRNVSQLQHAASKLQRLHQAQPSTAPADSTAIVPSVSSTSSAQLFLAQQGVNIQQQGAYLSSLSLSTRLPASAAPSDSTDLSTFLQRRHAAMIDELVRESIASVEDHFQRSYTQALEDEWEREKREILDSLGFRSGKRGIASAFVTPSKAPQPSASSFPAAAFASPPSFTSSSLSLEQQKYAEVIVLLNQKRLIHHPLPLITALRDAASSLSSSQSGRPSSLYHEVTDVFSLLRILIQERDVTNLQYQRNALTESYYQAQYLASSSSLQQQLIGQALVYCEEVFKDHVRVGSGSLEQYVINAVNGANVGERVRDYLGTTPVWPLVFFQLRSGERDAALSTVRRFAESTRIEHGVLLSAMHHHAGAGDGPFNALPSSLQRLLTEEFNREFLSRATSSIDPYKLALYTLIGHFTPPASIDLYQYIADSTESYLWYKLSLIDSPSALSTLQQMLVTKGELHFNADGQHPLLFFRVLLLTQCFEHAVVYLMRTQWWSVGVHAAIVLKYYGLLRVCEGEQLLVQERDDAVSVNVGKIVSKFVEELVNEHTELAFHYLYTLYPSTAALQALSSLLLHSKRTSLLIGGPGAEGLLGKYLTQDEKRAVIQHSSDLCVQRGEAVDAIELLLLGDQRNQAAELGTRELSRVVTADMRDGRRVRLVQLAQQLEKSPSPTPSTSALSLLLSLVQFFDHYHLGPEHYDSALDALLPLRILPLSPAVPSSSLTLLPSTLQRVLGDVSVAVLNIYYHKYVSLGDVSSGRGAGEREAMRRELRSRVRALVDFVGMHHGQVGVDVHAKMVRLEALMS